MSEHTPSPSSTINASPLRHKKSKRKYDKTKLPTPPPDPHLQDCSNEEKKEIEDVFEYIENLQRSANECPRSSALFAPAIITENAFLHLEKLYKLMEQLLELREQNARLKRRVRDLEYFNNIEKMHKLVDMIPPAEIQVDCPYLERDTAIAETYLEAILAESRKEIKEQKSKGASGTKVRQSILKRQRLRSGSVTEKTLEMDELESRRISNCGEEVAGDNKTGKVSKWTKVKAAFKWEKASVGDAKSQDSGLGGMVPVNLEVARYLRVPSTSEEGHSPADSGAAGISTPGSLSTASSTEDFQRNAELRTPVEDVRSSEDESSHNYIPHPKEDQSIHKLNLKGSKTPWAKVKDIIQTRNSVKKKNRLSAQSDDIQIDIELCSDNEDVFIDENKNASITPSKTHSRSSEGEIPSEVLERYHQVVSDDTTSGQTSDPRKVSKWTRVKKAFLTEANKDIKTEEEYKSAQAEINRNYKKLQKKLSLEFQEKLNEWERMKQSSPGTSNPPSSCGFVDETRDSTFVKKMEEWQKIKSQPPNKKPTLQLTSEENLPPEFRKKLEEWKKIKSSEKTISTIATTTNTSTTAKKRLGETPKWKSLGAPKCETPTPSSPVEYPAISEDFKKKLDEWKQIKASGGPGGEEQESRKGKDSKGSSPGLSRDNSKKPQKGFNEKEMQWFERELGKIEKEKSRLDREKQKFIEREERLAKLRRSVTGGKKEVLIHTPSGCHRFEGISRKFTQKLYEWEKAQGIAPEASTFALLSSSCVQGAKQIKNNSPGNTPPLVRSKSADSVAVPSVNCLILSQQPSSLSLNDVGELNGEPSLGSKSSSINYYSDRDEPEALIVEVEDIIEETASPLQTFFDKEQLPIYQRQETKAMCEGETVAAPKVRRSESVKAQTNYNLIEEIFEVLNKLRENENEIVNLETSPNDLDELEITNKQNLHETQKTLSFNLSGKVHCLQEANTDITENLLKNTPSCSTTNVEDILEQIQELSCEILQMAEKLNNEMDRRIWENEIVRSDSILNIIKNFHDKMLLLRRNLTYFCAASDLTAPARRNNTSEISTKNLFPIESNKESQESNCSASVRKEDKTGRENRLFIKAETSNTHHQGAIKKRIKYRQQNQQNRVAIDTDEEDDIYANMKRNRPRRLSKNRSMSEESAPKEDDKSLEVDETLVQKVVVPTQTAFVNFDDAVTDNTSNTPVTVFVKTTRKLFTPLVESQLGATIGDTAEKSQQLQKGNSIDSDVTIKNEETLDCSKQIKNLPPLPVSPASQKRILREISPSIRIMMVKYNKKLNEKDSTSCISGTSSGSGSPVSWRSPIAERRVKAQTEKYQEEVLKLSPLLGGHREVQKSASVGYISCGNRQITTPKKDSEHFLSNTQADGEKSVFKSSSASTILYESLKMTNISESTNLLERKPINLTLDLRKPLTISDSLELRKRKLQKAKEDFLQLTPPVSAPPNLDDEKEPLQFPTRNRLSQISVDSNTSLESGSFPGSLMKSASVGMISSDNKSYREGSTAEAKQAKLNLLTGKFALSNITSKFRKVRMRKGKDEKMSTVSKLCRQSLVVDIAKSEPESEGDSRGASSTEPSPSTSRSGSWIKKTKLFKK